MTGIQKAALAGCLSLALSGGLAGCGAGWPGKAGVSLRGMEIVAGNWWADGESWGAGAESAALKRRDAYRKRIQRNFGFRMREERVAGREEMAEKAAFSILAGAPIADILALRPEWAGAFCRRGLLAAVDAVKSVDFSGGGASAWNQTVREAFTFGGKTFAFAAAGGPDRSAAVVFFNRRLFAEAGVDPDFPYDRQKDGTWTWDVLAELCRELDGGLNRGEGARRYALCADVDGAFDAVAASNGAAYVGRDAAGRLVNGAGGPEFLEALRFARSLSAAGAFSPPPEGAASGWPRDVFWDGGAAMLVDRLGAAFALGDMGDEWGFVLFPRGPGASVYRFSSAQTVMGIPAVYGPDDLERLLFAYQLWMTPPAEGDDPREFPLRRVCRDWRALEETLGLIRAPGGALMEYHLLVPGLERAAVSRNVWWWEGDPAGIAAAVSVFWDVLIEEANGEYAGF